MIQNNIIATVITFIAAISWLRINDFLAHKGWITVHLSRKIIHIGTGPIFVLCWLLFPGKPADRFLAALVPGLISIQFALVGFGILKDDAAVQAMSRTGNPREILKGPLYYGVIFIIITLVYWHDTPIGMIGLMAMCGGDGLAEILGKRFGKIRLPWSTKKSWVGSLGMLFGGWIMSIAILGIYTTYSHFSSPLQTYLIPITIISLLCTMVESLPFKDIDNITITLTAIGAGHLFF